jgi:hypothetical protein
LAWVLPRRRRGVKLCAFFLVSYAHEHCQHPTDLQFNSQGGQSVFRKVAIRIAVRIGLMGLALVAALGLAML